jgi:hypothetical protein
MNSRKDIKQMLRAVRRNGYQVDEHAKHLKVLAPDGRFLVGVSSTPGDSLALKRIRSDLHKAGVLARR